MSRRQSTNTVFSKAIETATATNLPENLSEQSEEIKEEVKEEIGKEQFSGILKQMFAEKPKKKTGKAYTFYLDIEAHEKLEETAKEQGISTSKVLNKIIKTIYNLE